MFQYGYSYGDLLRSSAFPLIFQSNNGFEKKIGFSITEDSWDRAKQHNANNKFK